MKQIGESLKNAQNIVDYINDSVVDIAESRIDEGWKDFVASVKAKFKLVFEYLKGLVVKSGSYFLPVNAEGHIQPAITPLTAGQAYVDGHINKASTVVVMDKEGKKITKCRTIPQDAIKLYGSGNSIKYWERMITECEELYGEEAVNEVKIEADDPEAKYRCTDNDELLKEIEIHIKNPSLPKMLIWGAPGIGKTAILMNVIKKMLQKFPNYQLIVKTLSNETPDNFTLPKYIQVEGLDFATDVPKTWLPVYKPSGNSLTDQELDDKCGKGLLFIDELSRATPQVLNVILPLINEGIFNGYKLGSGWTIICASNRAEDEMSGQTNIGNALANRFDQLFYEPTVHTWRKWADQLNFISPLLLSWLSMPASENMSGGKFFYMDPNEDIDSVSPTTLMCTPRSWTNAMRKLACYSDTGNLEGFTIFDIPKSILARTLNSCVPASAVDAFMAFLEVVQKIGNFDQAVRDVWENGGAGLDIKKRDLNMVALPLAQLICTAHALSLPTSEEFTNLCKWIASTGSDQLASYVLDVFKNVFGGMMKENHRDEIFVIAAKRGRPKQKANWPLYKEAFAGFEAKWGVSIDDESMPNYREGIKLIRDKYQEIFLTSTVDGKEALG